MDLVVELIFGPIFHRWQLHNGPLTEEYADGILDLAMAALRPPAAASPDHERGGRLTTVD